MSEGTDGYGERRFFAPQRKSALLQVGEQFGHRGVDRFAQQHLTRSGGRREARGRVYRVAQRGEIDHSMAAHVADVGLDCLGKLRTGKIRGIDVMGK